MADIIPLPDHRFRESSKTPPPRRRPNVETRTREYLTPPEIEALITAAGKLGRHGHRDATMVLIAYRHGLRVSELVALRWEQIDLKLGLLHVRRRKNGIPSTHPLYGPEIRALRQIERDKALPYVFVSERKGPMTDALFRKIVARAGKAAGIALPVHPHMLRHSTGFKLANEGRDTRTIQHYLGHRNIQHTVSYTQLASDRFNGFWQD